MDERIDREIGNPLLKTILKKLRRMHTKLVTSERDERRRGV